ncbi:MAG TPA: biotin/lipoyl-containing protein [Acidobacteriota bacterium]|nr:biotin/lipoyl-containing protein [Acidobacteriota bacterium]
MIIEIDIEGEEQVRRYRVRRHGGAIRIWRLPDASGNDDDAQAFQVDWRMPEPGNYSLLVDGRSYDVHVDEAETDPDLLELHLLSHVVRLRASDARRRRTGRAGLDPDGTISVTAPIPGRVVKVLAPRGTVVERGDGIIVLEAMKMENELKAPRGGTVIDVVVEEGEGVEGGTVLATIE